MVTDPSLEVSLKHTLTANECETITSFEVTSSPALAVTVDSSTDKLLIPSVNDPSSAQVYQITVNAKTGDTVKDSKTFTLTVYRCDALTIDQSKFTSLAYKIEQPQTVFEWLNEDLTYEPLCGGINWQLS